LITAKGRFRAMNPIDLSEALQISWQHLRRPQTFARVAFYACVPIFGQLLLAAYALQVCRATALGETPLAGDFRSDIRAIIIGFKCQVLSLAAMVVAGLLTLPLWTLERSSAATTSNSSSKTVTGLMMALHSPTAMVTTLVMASLTGVFLTRYATTGSAKSILDVPATWSLLRAEPAHWIVAAALGFCFVEAPATIALALPLSASTQLPVLLGATALLSPLMLLIQASLIGQAHHSACLTIARRRPLIVKVRW
jgi:hypothetical protein